MPESCHVFAMEPEPFRAIALGLKTAVVLPLSLGIFLADQLVFREWRPETGWYTGNWICRRVTHEERGVLLPCHVGITPAVPVVGPVAQAGKAIDIDAPSAVYSLNNPAENESARQHFAYRMTRARGDGFTQDQFWEQEAEREHARRNILRHAG